MEMKKFENGYEFVNNSKGNRVGFVHETTLFKNGYEIANAKIQYYNRTWECYTYQSVMKKCISNLLEDKKERFINNYKYNNNIKRLTQNKKEQVLKDFEELEGVKELNKIYATL